MDSHLECVAAVLVISSIIKKKKKKKEKTKNCLGKKPWLNCCNELGVNNTLLRELHMEDEGEYKNF